MFATAEFWVAIAFVLFLVIVVYCNVPHQIIKARDGRADRIRNELEQARRLREEAQDLFATYQKQQGICYQGTLLPAKKSG